MSGDVLRLAERLRAEATVLLERGGLRGVLERYGEVTVVGSYALDLMVWPDIDVDIRLEPKRDSVARFFDLGKDVALLDGVVALKFHDFFRAPNLRLPKGLYWDVTVLRETGRPWKIDLWSMDDDDMEKTRAHMERTKKLLDDRSRELILDLKHSLITDEGRTPPLSGFYIYQAVLEEEIEQRDLVIQYLEEHGIDVPYDWGENRVTKG